MTLTCPQGRKMIPINLEGQFLTLGANVAPIIYLFIDEIHIVRSK
jgi:hypothetical protein